MNPESDVLALDRKIIKTEKYSYLVESKILLISFTPTTDDNRSIQIFLIGICWTSAAGFLINSVYTFWAGTLIFIGAFCAYYFVRTFLPGVNKKEWVLCVGSGENLIEIFRSADKEAFEAKRLEIESALMTRPSE